MPHVSRIAATRLFVWIACAFAVACAGKSAPSPTTGGFSGRVVLSVGTFQDVRVTVASQAMSGPSFSTITDENGRWGLSDLPTGTYQLTAEKPSYKAATATATVAGGMITTAPDLTLMPAGVAVFGCAEFPAPGPTSDTGVTAALQAMGSSSPSQPATVTAGTCPDGLPGYVFSFPAVAPGTYTVELTSPGYVGEVPAFAVSDADINLGIVDVGREYGQVIGNLTFSDPDNVGFSQNPAGITVTLTGGAELEDTVLKAVTDASGHFSFAHVPVSPIGGSLTLGIATPQWMLVGAAPSVQVMPSVSTTAPPLTVKPTVGAVSGCVIVPRPAPDSSGVTVAISGVRALDGAQSAPAPLMTGTTPCAGGVGSAFHVELPMGSYALTFARTGFMTVSSATVTVPAATSGIPADVALPTVVLPRAGVAIDGRVLASSGGTGLTNPSATSATVTLTGPGIDTPLTTTTAGTAADPTNMSFHFTNVPVPLGPTYYTITATKPGYVVGIAAIKLDPAAATLPTPRVVIAALSNQVTGCLLLPAPADANTSITVQLDGVAFDGSELSPARTQTLTQSSPDCGQGIAGVPGLAYSFSDVPNGEYSVTVSDGTETLSIPASLTGNTGNLELPPVEFPTR